MSRKNETCTDCCSPATCYIAGAPFFDAIDQRYKWRFEIRYTNAASATLTGFDGAAFTYPSFSGIVIVDAGLCQFNRFVLTVTAPSGQVRECVFANPNCCCVPYRRPEPNEYRVPMSRGINKLQPSMLVTISGVRQAGNTLPDCGWPGFFNRSFLVPFHTALVLSESRQCVLNPPIQNNIVRSIGSLRIVWGHRSYPNVSIASCPTNEPCPFGGFVTCYAYGVSIHGELATIGLSTSSFDLYTERVFSGVADYEQICNPYKPECEALSNIGGCTFYPQATSFPASVRCSDQINSLGCFGLPATTCARDCGLLIFRDLSVSFQLVAV